MTVDLRTMPLRDGVVVPVDVVHYMMTHVLMAKYWGRKHAESLEWVLSSMRGELPPEPVQVRNYDIQHMQLPTDKYMFALRVLSDLDIKCAVQSLEEVVSITPGGSNGKDDATQARGSES